MKKKHDINDMTEEEKGAYEKLQEKFELVPKKPTKETLLSHTAGIISKNAKTLAISVAAFAVLYTFLFGLWKVPGIEFGFTRMSEITAFDIFYLILISSMAGALVTLVRHKIAEAKTSKLTTSGSVFAAFVSAVCPVCQGVTIAALGSTIAFLPLAFLAPYVWLLQLVTIFILSFSVYLTSNSIYTKTCTSCVVTKKIEPRHTGKVPFLYENNIAFGALIVMVLMLAINNFMIGTAFASSGVDVSGGSISLEPGFEYGSKVTLKPMPLAAGENPRIQGYRSIVKSLTTISELSLSPPTGDVAQDLVNNIIPKGTPWYGSEAGVSFDDPITAQKLWAGGRAIQLSAEEQKRWERIVNSFTCDYCCGSPQQPTIITRCGCAHSAAAQGMAKWFIKNYGGKYSDEEIYGEMARWYALWYPGPTVNRIVQELQA